ncbi:MAG: GTP pyrophosphokinase, partial [Candidatus Berkelbacteria bacterium Licking1014_96]
MLNQVQHDNMTSDEKILLQNIRGYLGKEEVNFVILALDFAKSAHRGQRRISGKDYIIHPLFVARILSELKLDAESIAAALLHDVCEDTKTTPHELKEEFGSEVAQMVTVLTKLKKISVGENEVEHFDERTLIAIDALRRVFFAMAEDLRVVIIKLADRLHNIKDISVFDREKQKRIARETLYIYAPLASRLGMGEFKRNLEDGAFKTLNPAKFKEIKKHYRQILTRADKMIKKISLDLKKELNSAKIEAKITFRVKNIYGLHKKLIKLRHNYQRIYDLLGIRIIVKTKEDCYKVLGLIHQNFRPIPNQFSDYIALPKLNGYQSIHTIVRLGAAAEPRRIRINHSVPLEFQIRTYEMDYQANFGVASHFYYSDIVKPKDKNKRDKIKTPKKELAWIKELAEWQAKIKDSRAYIRELKIDFFNDRIFVFTPKGEVKDLPAGSTPIDFAYAVHSYIGDHARGARVDGVMRGLDFKLSNGEVVEIIINKNQRGPNADWLAFAKSASAKDKIRSYINKLKKSNS